MLHLLKRLSLILTVGFILILHTPVLAGMPGEAAPELRIKEWVQGGPFTLQGGQAGPFTLSSSGKPIAPIALRACPIFPSSRKNIKRMALSSSGLPMRMPQP